MKKFIATVAVASFVATSAFAGSLVEPEMEPMVEVMEEESNSSGLLLPLLAIVAIGLLISNSGSDEEEESNG